MGETNTLAAFTVETTYDDVPTSTVEKSKEAIRDLVGVAVYGSHHEIGEKIATYVDRTADGDEATVFGRGTASPTGAAISNATFGHAIDYDDTFESIVIHPTSPVFTAALVAAELTEASGRELLTGYVVGCEVAFRIGHSTYPGHYQQGWHATGTISPFGAAAATASVLGLDVEDAERAFGIVASSSSSLKKNFGSMTKPLHAGHAAQMGVRAGLLAESGFTADEAVLEGSLGYGAVMTPDGEYDPSSIDSGLGEEWAVDDIGYKPYPSGVITHAAMDALRSIVIEADLEPADVESITVALDEAASEMLIHADPSNSLQAKFSIEFCLAAILRERDAGIHEFTDAYVEQAETKAAISKVERDFESNLFDGDYAGYGARVDVETVDGRSFTKSVTQAPGSPSNPVSEERLGDKFTECAETVLSESTTAELASVIDSLEEPDAVDRLTNLVAP
ncbi:MmgE/PrpD family protein [Natronorubrum sp. FCH18a]|uniref:MmgE/PrpD family protein n=1 Tax=Natronorubrum sp. FCH18a TaxID=3447018 RepID=UPI003F50E2C8